MLLVRSLAYKQPCKKITAHLFTCKSRCWAPRSMATQQSTIPERAHAVLSYWFGPTYDAPAAPGSWASAEISKLWFQGGEEVDQFIKLHFSDDVAAMQAGAYDDWLTAGPFSAMAGILLTDQFTRNVYRGSAEAFSMDAKALSWATELYESGRVQQLPPVMRHFVVLPFMHSETLEDQQHCVDLVTAEYEASSAHDPESAATKAWASQVKFAKAHRDVIAKWGRFPHRNLVLGRQNTPDEEQGLADGSISRW